MYFNGEMYFDARWIPMGVDEATLLLLAILVAPLVAAVWSARSVPRRSSCNQQCIGRKRRRMRRR